MSHSLKGSCTGRASDEWPEPCWTSTREGCWEAGEGWVASVQGAVRREETFLMEDGGQNGAPYERAAVLDRKGRGQQCGESWVLITAGGEQTLTAGGQDPGLLLTGIFPAWATW